MVVMAPALLGGCGGGSGLPSKQSGSEFPTESVTGDGVSKTIARDGEFDLAVSGKRCTVIVDRGTVRSLSVIGDGNVVTIRPAAKVLGVKLTGNDNHVKVPPGTTRPNLSITGNHNVVAHE
jgi:hypothetical protein